MGITVIDTCTSNLTCQKGVAYEQKPSTSRKMEARRPTTEKGSTIKRGCIFCGKDGKRRIHIKGAWNSEGTKFFKLSGDETVVLETE